MAPDPALPALPGRLERLGGRAQFQPPVVAPHERPRRVLDLALPDQGEPGLTAHPVRRGVGDGRIRVQIPMVPLGRGRQATSPAAAAAIPRPWNGGSTAQPVSYTGSPRHSRSQYPMLPTVSSSGSSTIRYIRPAPGRVSSAYRRWRTRIRSSLSGPPRWLVISGLLTPRSSSRQDALSSHGSSRTRTPLAPPDIRRLPPSAHPAPRSVHSTTGVRQRRRAQIRARPARPRVSPPPAPAAKGRPRRGRSAPPPCSPQDGPVSWCRGSG